MAGISSKRWSAVQRPGPPPGAQTERRGGAGPVRGLLGGKASPAAFQKATRTSTRWKSRSLIACDGRSRSKIFNVAKDIVITRRGVVVVYSRAVDADGAGRVVEAAAHALAVGPTSAARAAVGLVAGDPAVADGHRAATHLDTAAEAVAAAGTHGHVGADRAARDGQGAVLVEGSASPAGRGGACWAVSAPRPLLSSLRSHRRHAVILNATESAFVRPVVV